MPLKKFVIRAVVDTNVLISGATGSTTPAQVIDGWRQNKYILVTSPQLIAEVNEVIRRPEIIRQFNLSESLISGFVGTLSTRAYVTPGTLQLDVIKEDPPDNQVLSAAVEGSADYIVSGDKDLLRLGQYQDIAILKPIDFLDRII